MSQDLQKTFSFFGVHLMVGFGVAYVLTGSVMVAGGIALIEPAVNAVAFYFHERHWKKRGVAQSHSHAAEDNPYLRLFSAARSAASTASLRSAFRIGVQSVSSSSPRSRNANMAAMGVAAIARPIPAPALARSSPEIGFTPGFAK